MDIKAKVDEIVAKVKGDKNIAAKFQKDPIKTVEELAGVDLPDDQIAKVVDLVKAKLGASAAGEKLSGLSGKLGGILGKK